MDSNTKIIILVLILVIIKIFAPTIDYFENTKPESEQCTTILVNPRPPKCPSGQKLIGGMCWEEKKICVPSIDHFANTPLKEFKLYNSTYKVYLTNDPTNNNLFYTTDAKAASLFNVDSENNLKHSNLFCNYLVNYTLKTWKIVLKEKKDFFTLKFDGKNIFFSEYTPDSPKYFREYLSFPKDFGILDIKSKMPIYTITFDKKETIVANFEDGQNPTINNSSFKIYNPTFKVYLQRIDDTNFAFTSDSKLATLFNIDSTNNLKYLSLYVNFNKPGNSNLKPPHSIYKWILYLNSKKDSGESIKYDGKNITSIYINNSKIMLILNKNNILEFLPIGDKKPLDSDGNFIPVF